MGFFPGFNSYQQVEARLLEADKLTPEEVRALVPWMRQISEGGMRRLNVELDLQNLEAIQNFEKSSSRLTWGLIMLSVVLVVLTLVIAFYTILLARTACR